MWMDHGRGRVHGINGRYKSERPSVGPFQFSQWLLDLENAFRSVRK